MKCRRDFLCSSPILFFFQMWSNLGVKTEYSYVTRNHMASFPFRILKPETSFNMCMPTMTLCSQKVNGPLRSKVQSSSSHSGKGCLSGELKGDDELLFFFFSLVDFLKIVSIVDYGVDEWRQTFHMYLY